LLEWSHSVPGRVLPELAQHNTLVRLDSRGSGLSERVLPTALDDLLLDYEAVVDRLGLDQFRLLGIQASAPSAIAFAARHSQRIPRFVILNGYARYADVFATPQAVALLAAAASDWELATEAIGTLVHGIGRDESLAHGAFIRASVGPEFLRLA